MRQHFLTAALCTACVAAYGQNLNPTVEVTNAYEGGAAGIVKPDLVMHVPDSVMTFNLDFDYAVFENPYKGAYEFRPYSVQLRPQALPSTENRFYLKAGAGYGLHPELVAVWTPFRRKGIKVNLHADHHSYFGAYREIDPAAGEGLYRLEDTGGTYNGYESHSRAGVNGSYTWGGGTADMDVSYLNLLTKDALFQRSVNALQVTGRVRSLNPSESGFYYEAMTRYRYGAQYGADLFESRYDVDGTLGVVMGDHRILTDVGALVAKMGAGDRDLITGRIYATPHYVFDPGNWYFDLGVKVSALLRPSEENDYQKHSGLIFPAVRVEYRLWDDRIVLQAAATGGDRVNAWDDLLERNPFVVVPTGSFDNSVERIRAMLGVRGHIAERFQYDLQLGYARWNNALLDALSGDGTGWISGFGYADYNHLFAELRYAWRSEHVTVDGRLNYGWNDVSADHVFAPAAFTGFIRPAWHWGGRLTAGFEAAFSTSRSATSSGREYVLPGYMDLGLYGEFGLSRSLTLWARMGNLLNQTIQRVPFHAEQGIYTTAGLKLTF